MKTYKKIGLGLLATILFTVFVFSFNTHKALAYIQGPVSKDQVKLSFTDRSDISGTINGAPVTFTDGNPTDTNYNYTINQNSIFCNSANITINGDTIALSASGNATASSADATLKVQASTDATKAGCNGVKTDSVDVSVGNAQAGMNYLAWQSDGTLLADGNKLTEVGTTNLYEQDTTNSCGGKLVAVVTDDGSAATTYSLQPAEGRATTGFGASGFDDLSSTSLTSCFVQKVNGQTPGSISDAQKKASVHFGVSGSRQTPGTGGVGSGTTGTGGCDTSTDSSCPGASPSCDPTTGANCSSDQDSSACVANSHTSLEWLLCPVLTAMSKTADVFNDTIQAQLHFNINGNLPDGGQVNTAWTLIKDLVTAMLVIILLVMVFAQAIGGGPFDAYTVKKMLPRIVIAVIGMQFSWVACKWLIGLANDAGYGVAQILTAPFGGAGNMDLPSLIHHLGLNPVLVTGGQYGVTALLFIILATFSDFILLVLALIAFIVLAAVITALVTLLFRNLLIILLVIFSPLALLAWIFPSQGMQKYWKVWSGNFTKLLMLFPLMMGIIYGGRIMAWVAGGGGNPGLLDFIVVLVGFFGPYFFLPKAFKWGGTFLATANKAIVENKAFNKGRSSGLRALGGALNRQRGDRANDIHPDMANLEANKFSNRWYVPPGLRGKQSILAGANGKVANRIATGYILPTARHRNLAKKLGKSWSAERAEENEAYLDDDSRTHARKGISDEELYGKGGSRGNVKGGHIGLMADMLQEHNGIKDRGEAEALAEASIPDSVRVPGVAAGKWSVQMLALKAFKDKDSEMQKAIARYHIQHQSLLEMGNGSFLLPEYETDRNGKAVMGPNGKQRIKWQPFMNWGVAIDQAYKDDGLWKSLSAMRGNYPPNNWPKGGARYDPIYAMAGFTHRPDGSEIPQGTIDKAGKPSAAWHKVFGGKTRINDDGEEVPDNREAVPLDREFIAQKIQDIDEAELNDLSHGGNTAVSTLREARDMATGRGWGMSGINDNPNDSPEVRAAKNAPVPEVAQRAIETVIREMDTTAGLSNLQKLTTPAVADTFNEVVAASGATHFVDSLGQVHPLTTIQDMQSKMSIALQRRNALLTKNPDLQLAPVPAVRLYAGSPPPSAPLPTMPEDPPPESGDERGYRPPTQESSHMEMPEGGERVRTYRPTSRPTRPSEFEETEYGSPASTVLEVHHTGSAGRLPTREEVNAVDSSQVEQMMYDLEPPQIVPRAAPAARVVTAAAPAPTAAAPQAASPASPGVPNDTGELDVAHEQANEHPYAPVESTQAIPARNDVTNVTNNVTNVTQEAPARRSSEDEGGAPVRATIDRADLNPLVNNLQRGMNESLENFEYRQRRTIREGLRKAQVTPQGDRRDDGPRDEPPAPTFGPQ